jgi:hypothetical protein
MLRALKASACLGIGAAVLLTATASSARITWDLQPGGTQPYDWTFTQHWLFNESSSVPDAYTNGYCSSTNPCAFHGLGAGTAPDVDNLNTEWAGNPTYGTAAPECLEVTTHPGLNTSNPDTVIEALDSSGTWQMVNDDMASGVWQSHARIWLNSGGDTMEFGLRIRAYGYWENWEDFNVTITRRDVGTGNAGMAACTTNQSLPWVQFTSAGGSINQVAIHAIQQG